jgi:hypothetical protein
VKTLSRFGAIPSWPLSASVMFLFGS